MTNLGLVKISKEIQSRSESGKLRVFQLMTFLLRMVLFAKVQLDGLFLSILKVKLTSGLRTRRKKTTSKLQS
jgi:uncharacterized membrane protein